MKFKATFKVDKAPYLKIIEGEAIDKETFLKNCQKNLTINHKLIKLVEG